MGKMLINATQRDELRSVIIDGNNRLVNYDIDTHQQEQKKSNIYKAVITKVEKSLGALFVNFGSERMGFLPFSNVSPEYYNGDVKNNHNPDLEKLFKIGQEIVVQVEKDERGNKGAALTTYISLAGSYCVLMPNNARGGGISRQIEGKERESLQEKIEQMDVPEGMGIIVRTAGVNRSAEELSWDMKILLRYWDAIKQAAIAKPGPYLIHQESNVVLRSVRDNLREDIDEVIIDDESAFKEVHDYVRLVRPDFLDRIKLHNSTTPLFSHYQVEAQIEMAYQHELQLSSGGSIVIDHTEALVSIDVNSARATKGDNIEETALQTNLEAADEIARQLRIRDLGGLIVIDFIDMTPMQNRREVENRLRDALKIDRARIQTERISRFGLLEMSRQRLRRALSKTIKETCPRCNGQGMVQSVESLASTIIHRIEQQAAKTNSPLHFTIHAPLSLSTYLTNERRDSILLLEANGQAKITVIPNQHMETPEFSFKTSDYNSETSSQVTSYECIQQIKSAPANKEKPIRTFDEPIINQYLNIPDAAGNPAGSGTGLFKRLMTRMFGDEKEPEMPAIKKPVPNKVTHNTVANRRPSQSTNRTRDLNRNRSNSAYKEELPIPSVTRQVDEKPSLSDSQPRKSSDTNRTRRGNRGGSRNHNNRIDTGSLTDTEANTADKQEQLLPNHEETSKVKLPVAEPVSGLETAVEATAAPAKPQRRSLSSAKKTGATASRTTGAKKVTRTPTNPTKRIKPRSVDEAN